MEAGLLSHLNQHYVFPKLLRPIPSQRHDPKGLSLIITNMIVEFLVEKVARRTGRIESIEGSHIRVLSLCHSSRYLYQERSRLYKDRDSQNSFEPLALSQTAEALDGVKGMHCVIDKERYIYDKDMPHLSYEIEDVRVGDRVVGMVVENDGKTLVLTL